jgi:hypothetical protein
MRTHAINIRQLKSTNRDAPARQPRVKFTPALSLIYYFS